MESQRKEGGDDVVLQERERSVVIRSRKQHKLKRAVAAKTIANRSSREREDVL